MITIELPWINTALLPNNHDGLLKFGGRKAYYALKAARDQAKNDAYLVTLEAMQHGDAPESSDDLNVSIEFNPPHRARVDWDGIARALKPSLDGVAEALHVNDFHFNPVRIWRGAYSDFGRITIQIDDLPF